MSSSKVDHNNLTPKQRQKLGSPAGMSLLQSMMDGEHKPQKGQSNSLLDVVERESKEKGVAGAVTNEFIAAPDGSLNLGEITPGIVTAIGRQAGNIRLTRGPQNADKSGYGLAHRSQ